MKSIVYRKNLDKRMLFEYDRDKFHNKENTQMGQHETFHYASLDDVRAKAQELNAFVPLQEDTSALYNPLALGHVTAPIPARRAS